MSGTYIDLRRAIQKFKDENKDKKIHIIEKGLITNSGIKDRLWEFRLKRYGVPVYDCNTTHFMLIGWRYRNDHLPEHIWLVPICLYRSKNSIFITNDTKYLLLFKKFEITYNILNKKVKYDETGTIKHYLELAKKDGFDDIKEWSKWKDDINSKLLPENKSCTKYIGKIGENVSDLILIELFGELERNIPLHGERYDRIVKGGHKIDVKVRCLRYKENHGWIGWSFEIDNNNKTDYFLLIGIDNLIDKNLMYIWLIHKDEIIRGHKFHERTSFNITNKRIYILELQRYEITNKLKNIKMYRDMFKCVI